MCHEKSTNSGYRKGSGIAGNPEYVRVGTLVDGMQCWLVHEVCVSVLLGGGGFYLKGINLEFISHGTPAMILL